MEFNRDKKRYMAYIRKRYDNVAAHRAALHNDDTETTTVGCRSINPANCGRNMLPDVCAFTRPDGKCLAPPTSWKKQYQLLLNADITITSTDTE